MQPIYLALLEDEKTVITKSSFDLIRVIPVKIKYIIKQEFDRHVKVGVNESDLYAYSAVDLNNNYKPIELNNFTIIDLGTDYHGKYASERNTVVKENRTGECRKFHSVGGSESFILHHLIPLFNKLESACSWSAIDKFLELDELKKENENLKEKIRILEAANNSALN